LAADQNLADAQFQYGVCLSNGRGVERDLMAAAQYYRVAADQNESLALFAYAVCLTDGEGIRMDLIEAAKYFRLAAGFDGQHAGDSDGDEGFCQSGVSIPAAVARAIYERSIDEPCFKILTYLGQSLEFGDRTTKDVGLAAKCHALAASGGKPEPQVNYGIFLQHGLGVGRNPSESVEFYKKSMQQQNPAGAGHYGLSVHFGNGCCEDVEWALDHYDFVLKADPAFLSGNSSRCFRGLNKRWSGRGELDREQNVHESTRPPGTNLLDLIAKFRVGPIGSTLDPPLGRGAFGTVSCGRDPKNPEQMIAVKRLDSTDWESFKRELEILVRVQHPCIIELKGWSPIEARSFEIQMKFAPNGTLRDHIGGTRAYLGLLRNRTRQACLICDIVLGMRYVHSCGFMHRDLKPQNILLDENWRGLISDFGHSRSGSATGPPTPNAGTFAYAAPEQRQGDAPYTAKVDVFAFGLIAYEMIAGHPAFESPESTELSPPPSYFGSFMQNLIQRCWSSNPNARPLFEEVFHDFERRGWQILPEADPAVIAASVSKVLKEESQLMLNVGSRSRV
jgi:hypothetical protein